MTSKLLKLHKVDSLYLQLNYGCNFNCRHCFHGERLKLPDKLTHDEVMRVATEFRKTHSTKKVVLLGGEPFLHSEIVAIANDLSGLGLGVDVCTNGFRIGRRLHRVANAITMLRISFEGLEGTHDAIRRPGSFAEALRSIRTAKSLGMKVGATITATSESVDDLVQLLQLLRSEGVTHARFHQLRLIGNAAMNPELAIKNGQIATLQAAIAEIRQMDGLVVDVDGDLLHTPAPTADVEHRSRVEIQPTGEAYVSCKAVGTGRNAFWLDRQSGRIVHRPNPTDEVSQQISDVIYL